MCVIIYAPPGKRPSIDRIRECQRANPDGWGVMWMQYGKLFFRKSIKEEFVSYYERFLDDFLDTPLVMHFRTASMGQISADQCHPHRANENLLFAHNGNLFHFSDYFYTDRRTDSQRFCEWLSRNWCPVIVPDLKRYCMSNYSKMVFMNSKGQVWICNEAAGMWENGCWYSNGGIEHYTGYGYSGAYGYGKGECRHKGGLISVQGFGGEWKQCEYCKGWFKDLNKLCPDCEAFFDLVGLQ